MKGELYAWVYRNKPWLTLASLIFMAAAFIINLVRVL